MNMKQKALDLRNYRIEQFRNFAAMQPDHPFTAANHHMLNLSAQNTWNGTGEVSMTGLAWWALNMMIDVAYPHTVIFNATGGPGVDICLFSSAVTGYFYVDPSTLNGEYQFTMEAVAGVAGEVSIDLYDMNWGQVGSFLGVVAGVSVAKVSGSGTAKYN